MSTSTSTPSVGPRVPSRFAEVFDILGRIDAHPQLDATGQRGQARQLGSADDLVGDEDVPDARIGEHLGLAELRAEEGIAAAACDILRQARRI